MYLLKWNIGTSALIALIVCGFALEVEGAKNFLLFYVWVKIFITIFVAPKTAQKAIKKRADVIPRGLDALREAIVLGYWVYMVNTCFSYFCC